MEKTETQKKENHGDQGREKSHSPITFFSLETFNVCFFCAPCNLEIKFYYLLFRGKLPTAVSPAQKQIIIICL